MLHCIRWWYSKFSSQRFAPSYEVKNPNFEISYFLDFFLTSQGEVQKMNSQKCHFFFHRKVRNVERRILNTINVYGRAKIGVQKAFLQYFAYFCTNFCSIVYVDGIQNSPLDVPHLPMMSKIRILRFHISLTFSWLVKERCKKWIRKNAIFFS